MFLFFLPVVYAVYTDELMLEKATLQTYVTRAKATSQYVDSLYSDIMNHTWDFKSTLTMDEMFQLSLPMMKGMEQAAMLTYVSQDSLMKSLDVCEEIWKNSTEHMMFIEEYFSGTFEEEFMEDVKQKQNIMIQDLGVIQELCIHVEDAVKKLIHMVLEYREVSHLFLTRAQHVLLMYRSQSKRDNYLSTPSSVNYTEALYNFSLMQNSTNLIYSYALNLTSEENEYL